MCEFFINNWFCLLVAIGIFSLIIIVFKKPMTKSFWGWLTLIQIALILAITGFWIFEYNPCSLIKSFKQGVFVAAVLAFFAFLTLRQYCRPHSFFTERLDGLHKLLVGVGVLLGGIGALYVGVNTEDLLKKLTNLERNAHKIISRVSAIAVPAVSQGIAKTYMNIYENDKKHKTEKAKDFLLSLRGYDVSEKPKGKITECNPKDGAQVFSDDDAEKIEQVLDFDGDKKKMLLEKISQILYNKVYGESGVRIDVTTINVDCGE